MSYDNRSSSQTLAKRKLIGCAGDAAGRSKEVGREMQKLKIYNILNIKKLNKWKQNKRIHFEVSKMKGITESKISPKQKRHSIECQA